VQGYNEESAELARQAVKRLNVCKLAVEYLYHKDQYDKDEVKFSDQIEKGWNKLSEHQKDVIYYHLIQGMSFTLIADLKGVSPQAVFQTWKRACRWFNFG
jgi:DNA-directed RNA polymerase specialized sigma24 family protein